MSAYVTCYRYVIRFRGREVFTSPKTYASASGAMLAGLPLWEGLLPHLTLRDRLEVDLDWKPVKAG